MKEITVKIIDPVGIHARPATMLTGAATKFKSECKIITGQKEANLKSIMNVMALGVKCGTDITIRVNGEDEDAALENIEKVLKDNNLI
ncbi:HPr family phosphocarrier protein [Mycoplasma sp. NEAQ87857]|uniref:HPr family phosphocarrier protein n=1 Tax=Mycoplasma sp. NEAQ87857 TaxID=2683967 RepID=UPI0013194FB0|nr:HPr family phosphocarrier protein [Mycoplasma sp. NEAQ87857]QGZ97614.1 HPr family phosphocarrier protein [Mycoplasma sp. NEAQ87857]